jgi:TRAP transporter 4TM/12TM fusion protein
MNAGERTARRLSGKTALLAMVLAVGTSLIHIWFNSFGLLDLIKKNCIHLNLLMSLGFLYYPATARSPLNRPSFFDWFFFALTLGAGTYFLFGYERLVESVFRPILSDYIYGGLFMILMVEASRRLVGWPITILAVFFLLYTYLGPYMPGPFAHQGFTVKRIITRMTMTDEGILGVAVMVSSSYIFMFILFSSFLKITRASEFFNDLASAIAGTRRGGPAKIAIFASALTGTISGSSQANVVTTGTFTIPLMKSIGYRPHFAGAVEAVASTGGMLMPPVMGAAAFIMTSFLGISYTTIMFAGFIPALLYYFSLYNMVDLRALKRGIEGLPREQLPGAKRVLLDRGHLAFPLVAIIFFLVIGYSPLIAAFIGIISVLLISFVRKSTRIGLRGFIYALNEGAVNAIEIAAICGIVGFIIGSVGMTGIGQVVGQSIVQLAGDRLWVALILCMITAMILGMGLPAPACYMITVTIAAPALILMGVSKLASHFFVFYFGSLSGVIPPVALTSYTAGAIAKASPTKVAVTGFGLASAGIILPYMFVYNPVLLLIDFTWGNFVFSLLAVAIGLYCLAVALMGVFRSPLSVAERILFSGAAFLLIPPMPISRMIGLALFGTLLLFCFFLRKKIQDC